MNQYFKIRNGFTFGGSSMFFGVFILPLTLIALYQLFVEGYSDPLSNTMSITFLGVSFVLVFFLSLFVFTSSRGVQFDIVSKKFRLYTSFIGMKFGEWFSLEFYNYISVIQSRKSGRIGRVTTVGVTDLSYQLIFMDKTHRNKKVVKVFERFDDAKNFAEMLSSKIKLPLVQYSPKRISNKR